MSDNDRGVEVKWTIAMDRVAQAVEPDSRLRVWMLDDPAAPQDTNRQVGLVFACCHGQVQLGMPQPGQDQPARSPVLGTSLSTLSLCRH